MIELVVLARDLGVKVLPAQACQMRVAMAIQQRKDVHGMVWYGYVMAIQQRKNVHRPAHAPQRTR